MTRSGTLRPSATALRKFYWITSSAVASSEGTMVTPSANQVSKID